MCIRDRPNGISIDPAVVPEFTVVTGRQNGHGTRPIYTLHARRRGLILWSVCDCVQGCSRTCYQKNVIKRCGCGDVYYPLRGAAFGGVDVLWPACLSTNTTQGKSNNSLKVHSHRIRQARRRTVPDGAVAGFDAKAETRA